MVTNMAAKPSSAIKPWRSKKVYAEPKRSLAITADALNTMMSPMNTSSSVTMKSVLSTLTRLATDTPLRSATAEVARGQGHRTSKRKRRPKPENIVPCRSSEWVTQFHNQLVREED